jgi:uncharacterized protein
MTAAVSRPRHVPLRRCVVCRAALTKPELVRLVRHEGTWRVDEAGRAGGRGTWVCRDCIAGSHERTRRKAFARTFRQQTDEVVTLLGRAADAARGVTPAHAPCHGGTHG